MSGSWDTKRRSLLIGQVLVLAAALLLFGCKKKAPENPERTFQEIFRFSSELASNPTYQQSPFDWRIIFPMRWLSLPTILFLNQDWDAEEVAPFLLPFLTKPGAAAQIRALHGFQSHMRYNAVRFNPTHAETLQPLDAHGSDLQRLLRVAWENLRRSKKIGAQELIDKKEVVKYLCHEHCDCIAQTFAQDLATYPQLDLFTVRLMPSKQSYSKGIDLLPVKLQGPKGILEFSYHVALVVLLGERQVSIVDPLVLGSARLASVSEWMSRVQNPETLTVILSRPVPQK